MKSILTVIGTRPEAIKLTPVLSALSQSTLIENKVCVTSQHTDLLEPFLSNLGISIDYHFSNHNHRTTLHGRAARILEQFNPIFLDSKPDLVIVQGDTTTAFIASLSAYYARVPVAHIEAGLRTGHPYSPWPEEGHRCMIARLATYHFAPTTQAKNCLISEGIEPDKIWVVGNTSIDAVRIARNPSASPKSENRMIVATVHRRENHGDALKEICYALLELAEEFPTLIIKFLLHPNPAVYQTAEKLLNGIRNIDLLAPLDHGAFVQLLDQSALIITDSGGIQEEASFLGKPVIVVRETTERNEGIAEGTSLLVGTKKMAIVLRCKELLENREKLEAMSRIHYAYGDGYASEKIVSILMEMLCKRSS